jgi:hypothetical protein
MSYDNDMTHTKCQHVPLPEERNKNYLEKVSDALMALTNNVMDKRLLNNFPIYLNCRYDYNIAGANGEITLCPHQKLNCN